MVGSIITFLVVCAIVAAYMWIVHSFLREAEQREDAEREKLLREREKRPEPETENSRRPQWAH